MKPGRLLVLLACGAVLVLVLRSQWRESKGVELILAENEREVERMLAEHLAGDGAREPLGAALFEGDARRIMDHLLESMDLTEDEGATLDSLADGLVMYARPGREACNALLERTRPWIETLEQSVRAPRCAPRNPFDGSVERTVALVPNYQQLLQVIAAHARDALRRGDIDRALDLHVLCWALGCDWARRGTLIHWLLAMGAIGQAEERIAHVLAVAEPSPERLTRLVHEMERLEARRPSLFEAWRTEELWMRQVLGAASAGRLPDIDRGVLLSSDYASRLIFSRALDAYGPTRRRLEEACAGNEGTAALDAVQRVADAVHGPSNPILKMTVVVHPMMVGRRIDAQVRYTLLRTLVAVACHRAEQGGLPARLEDLVPTHLPAVPACPLTGEALRYEDGRVWSIGGDGEDDGGVIDEYWNPREAEGDVVLTLALRALREFPWRDEVPPEDRAEVEEVVQALYRSSEWWEEARDRLEDQDRAVLSHLVSEFARIERAPGFDSEQGRAKAAAIDAALRRLDGFMEVRWGQERGLAPSDGPEDVRRQALRWCNWWRAGIWLTAPMEPVANEP